MSPADVIGRRITYVLGEQVFARFKPYAEAALRGQRVEFDGHGDYGSLGVQYVHCTFDPEIDAAGQVAGYVAAVLASAGAIQFSPDDFQ